MRAAQLGLVLAMMTLAGVVMACGSDAGGETKKKAEPYAIATVSGSEHQRLTLTEKAVERLDLQTVQVDGSAVPYSAVLYDLDGKTFLYTNPEPLTYVRAPIVVASIDGDRALLWEGPPSGTTIVTVGSAELYGVDSGVGK